ncbi:ATP/GTP-binding protein [Pengzhenrongella sp.]|uniref:ATP/GTP-binding protein n=1 Tax=Pengzhenrongella sp. TaxID=2888820 RepID=UPI002F923C26
MSNPFGARGHIGPGGGAWKLLPIPVEFRGTTVQVCGLWAFAAGSSRPTVGVPIGRDIESGATVCCDPFGWFRAGIASSPSMLVLGLQGLGKSTFVIRQILGLADQGVVPLVLGDMKAEYVAVVRMLGGQVMRLGENQRINPLNPGAMGQAADRIGGEAGEILREQALQRAATTTATLIQIARRARLADWESSLVSRGVRLLDATHRDQGLPGPILPDLLHLLTNPPQELLRATLAASAEEFRETVTPLLRSLQAILEGPLGMTFSGETTERLDVDAPAVCVDVSAIRRHSSDVKAAIMMATWSEGYATVEASNALAEAGLGPQKHFLMVLDEMWEPLRIEGAGLVDQLDGLTRLNREDGVGNIFITHSLKDMESMASAADARKARGFAERSSIIVTAGLAREDLAALSEVKRLSEVEIKTVSGWTTPAGWKKRMLRDPATGIERPAPPPGAGKILIKVGDRAGIQVQVQPTETELALHDTNSRWLTHTREPEPAVPQSHTRRTDRRRADA